VRVLPDGVVEYVDQHPPGRDVIAYCSSPGDATSVRVAQQLREHGINAAVLTGGIEGWRKHYLVEPVAVAG
jgi:rhodanese-related sulfurtransferase